MAQCHFHQKKLSAFLDGELPPKKWSALAAHLAECASCRKALAAMKELGPILERLDTSPPPDGLVVRIMAEARRKESEKGLRHFRPRWLPAFSDRLWAFKALGTAAILVLMLFFGAFLSTWARLPKSTDARTAQSTTAGSATEGLEWFAPGPPGSLVSGYLAMAGKPGSHGRSHPPGQADTP